MLSALSYQSQWMKSLLSAMQDWGYVNLFYMELEDYQIFSEMFQNLRQLNVA